MAEDIGSFETSWIENFAEKLENVCSDTDAINFQESIKYIGHQLAVAGNHVFQFWSEVFQDHWQLMEREVYDSSRTTESVVVKKELSKENTSPRGDLKEADEYLLDDYVVFEQNTAIGNEASKPLDVDSRVLDESHESKSLDDGGSGDGNLSIEFEENEEFEQQTQADHDALSADGVSNDGNLSTEVGEIKQFEKQTRAEDLDALSDDGVSSDGNLSTFSTEPSGSDLELCDGSVESEESDGHSYSGKTDVSSTEGDTTDEEDLNKLDVDESFTSVDSHGSSSIRDSEEVVSDSKEVGEDMGFEQQTESEDLDASSNDGVSCDSNQSTFSSGESKFSSTKEVTDQENVFAKGLVDSAITDSVMDLHVTEEGAETDESQLNKPDVDESLNTVFGDKTISVNNVEEIISNSTEFIETKEFVQQDPAEDLHTKNQGDACSKLRIVDAVDSATTESVMDEHYFAEEEGTESDQSELNKLDVDESLDDVNSSDISSVRDLEDIVSDSMEFEENKDFEKQNIVEDIGAEQDVTSGWDSDLPSLSSLESVLLDDLCDDWIVL